MPVPLDLTFWKKSRYPEEESPDRAAFAAGSAAALLVLESRSGITGGVSTVALIRLDDAMPAPGSPSIDAILSAARRSVNANFGVRLSHQIRYVPGAQRSHTP